MPQVTRNYQEIDANTIDGFRQSLTQQLPYGTSFVLLVWPDDGVGQYHHLINANRRRAIEELKKAASILDGRGNRPQSDFR